MDRKKEFFFSFFAVFFISMMSFCDHSSSTCVPTCDMIEVKFEWRQITLRQGCKPDRVWPRNHDHQSYGNDKMVLAAACTFNVIVIVHFIPLSHSTASQRKCLHIQLSPYIEYNRITSSLFHSNLIYAKLHIIVRPFFVYVFVQALRAKFEIVVGAVTRFHCESWRIIINFLSIPARQRHFNKNCLLTNMYKCHGSMSKPNIFIAWWRVHQ